MPKAPRSGKPRGRESREPAGAPLSPTDGGDLIVTGAELPDYPGPIYSPESKEVTELQRLVSIRETQLADYVQRAQSVETQTVQLRSALDESEKARIVAESQLPIFRDQIDTSQEEIETLRQRVAELESELGKL